MMHAHASCGCTAHLKQLSEAHAQDIALLLQHLQCPSCIVHSFGATSCSVDAQLLNTFRGRLSADGEH